MATVPDLEARLSPKLRQQRSEMLARRGLPTLGFYEQLMVYPELFETLQALGTFVRFGSALPPRLREAEVLMCAVEQHSAFEWDTHVKSAAEAGVEASLSTAIASGAPLHPFGPGLEELRTVVRCVVGLTSVPQDAFDRLSALLGVKCAVEAVALAAMYRMFAGLGAGFDSAMPGGG
jgi:4-carboxymuconolactone decarboxylase